MPIYKSTLKLLGLFLLIIVPKCSLCLFAVGAAITACGIIPEVPSLWEYLLIGVIAILTASLLYIRIKGRFKTLLRLVLLSGIGVIGSFLFYRLDTSFYYIGVGMISAVSLFSILIEITNNKCCKVEYLQGIRLRNSVEEN